MSAGEEWGPWIEHDDTGMPSGVGPKTRVMIRMKSDGAELGPFFAAEGDWCFPGDPVGAYRIRKPKGLTMLEDLIAEIDAPATPRVDA